MARREHEPHSTSRNNQIEERARYECIDAVNKNEFSSAELLRLRNEGAHTWLEIWRMIEATRRSR